MTRYVLNIAASILASIVGISCGSELPRHCIRDYLYYDALSRLERDSALHGKYGDRTPIIQIHVADTVITWPGYLPDFLDAHTIQELATSVHDQGNEVVLTSGDSCAWWKPSSLSTAHTKRNTLIFTKIDSVSYPGYYALVAIPVVNPGESTDYFALIRQMDPLLACVFVYDKRGRFVVMKCADSYR